MNMVDATSLYPRVLVGDSADNYSTSEGVIEPAAVGVVSIVDAGYFNGGSVAHALHIQEATWFEYKRSHQHANHLFMTSNDVDTIEET